LVLEGKLDGGKGRDANANEIRPRISQYDTVTIFFYFYSSRATFLT